MDNKNYKEIYTVHVYNTGIMGASMIDFKSYEEALQYINDMLKYHNSTYRIEKTFISNKGDK